MKKQILTLTLAVLTTATLVAVRADSPNAKLPNCPVMGEPIDFSVSTDTPDGPAYFCCGGCIKKFKANPEKYAAAMAEQRAILAKRDKVQVKCPVSGEAVDSEVTTSYEGQTVAFCCGNCKKKFEADPGKYKAALAGSYTYQTKCPVMGETVSPKAYSVLPTGQTVYYCCKGCDKKFMADPAKYAPMLAAQGININVEKLEEMMAHDHDGDHDHDHGHDHDDDN